MYSIHVGSRRRAHAFVPSSADQNGMMGSMMQDLAFAIPGVDEAMSFAEIMKSCPPSFSRGSRS